MYMRRCLKGCLAVMVGAISLGMEAQGEPVGFQVDGINYKVRDNVDEVIVVMPQELLAQGYQYVLSADGTLVIPAEVSEGNKFYTVTGMAKDAVAWQMSLTRLVLPETMTDVVDAIHDCPALEFLDLGGASDVSTPMEVGLPALEELRFGCLRPLRLRQGSFHKLPALKVLRLPRDYYNPNGVEVFTALWDSFQWTPLLEEIHSPSPNPPLTIFSLFYYDCEESPYNGAESIGIANGESDICDKCEVYVPIGAKAAYGVHPCWHKFDEYGNIIEREFSGVEEVPADKSKDLKVINGTVVSAHGLSPEVYSLAGEKLPSSGLGAGIYIVRLPDGTARKIVVR